MGRFCGQVPRLGGGCGICAARCNHGSASWTAAEDTKLKAAVAKMGPETPDRWSRIAAAIGGGKTKDACKKHAKELGK